MIFSFLGHFVRKTWILVLAAWGLLLLGTWLAAPPWDQVAQDREFAFLPANAPSRQAGELYSKAFPQEDLSSNIVLVLHRSRTPPNSFADDLKFIEDALEPGLREIAESEGGLAFEIKSSDEPLFAPEGEQKEKPTQPSKRSNIGRIQTPNTLGVGGLLVSADRRAMLVVVELTTDFFSSLNWPTIDQISHLVEHLRQQGKIPEGLDISLTGSAIIGRDHTQAEMQSVRATGILTIVLVAGLLILIYRAPLLAVIPLLTVYLTVQISLNLLAFLAKTGHLTLFQGLQIYITILAYGAGVDYCLFLTARYKEELDRGADPKDAVAKAIGDVGAALTASAATVIGGIAMMMFAQFGKFREAGMAIPLSLSLVLFATLTFSPALLCLAGRWAFWPHRQRAKSGDERATAAPAESPGWFDQGGTLERIWEKVGQLLLRRAGTVWLLTVAVMAPFAIAALLLYHHVSYDVIGDLPSDATSAAGTQVLRQHFPAGIVGPVTVLLINPNFDFHSEKGHSLVERLTNRLRDESQQLDMADIRSLTAPLGITAAAKQDFSGIDLPPEVRKEGFERAAEEHYVTDMGERTKIGTRLDLVLNQSPFSRQSIEDLNRIEQAVRDALPDGLRHDSQLYFIGATASVRDLSNVMQQDRRRIELLVLGSVFLILVLLLQRFLVPLYLLLSVLFSYYTTLGVTFAVFWLLDPHGFNGIDWKVAIFLFTILIAVGEDYNIFLMTRVREESKRLGPVRGITEALDRTGPIISSCGIIMAGTFGSLLAGSLTEMKQLGFALAFGVLLDTFIVRPILVPAFLILVRTGQLPLLSRKSKESPGQAEKTRTPQTTSAP
jgi:putative drug exporter of the RND superfamily